MENVWMEIIEERLKRNCESALTKYSALYHQKHGIKGNRANGLIEKGSKFKTEPQKRFPIFQPLKKESDNNYLNGTVQYAYTPITMVLIEQKMGDDKNNMSEKSFAVMEQRISDVKHEKQTSERDDGFEWPGVHEVMEAYHKYAKGKFQSQFLSKNTFYVIFYRTSD